MAFDKDLLKMGPPVFRTPTPEEIKAVEEIQWHIKHICDDFFAYVRMLELECEEGSIENYTITYDRKAHKFTATRSITRQWVPTTMIIQREEE